MKPVAAVISAFAFAPPCRDPAGSWLAPPPGPWGTHVDPPVSVAP